NLYGEAPARGTVALARDLNAGAGGPVAVRFSADGSQVFVAAGAYVVGVELATGQEMWRVRLPGRGGRISPDGRYVAAPSGVDYSIAGWRGGDVYTVKIYARSDPTTARTVEIRGRGCAPRVFTGLVGVYLSDGFEKGVLFAPYADEPIRT